MNIILNFIPLKTGGGVQVALDFLRQAEKYGAKHNWYIVARKGGPFDSYEGCEHIKLSHLVVDNLYRRLKFEYIDCKRLVKKYSADLTYTQFGPPWPGSPVGNIAGCAYSNLFYPELNFWRALPLSMRLIKKIIDRQRLNRILSADVIIFETQDIAERAIQQYNLGEESVRFVRAAVSSLVTEASTHEETRMKCECLPDGYKILLLSGYHPNKNIEFLIDTAAELKSRSIKGVTFILTLPKDNAGTKSVMDKIERLGVTEYVYNFGPVPQEGCCELYRSCNSAVLPSTLESFSNMIAESWAMSKPLFISDLSWCRTLCGKGAIYYDFLNCKSLVDQILRYRDDIELQNKVVLEGKKELAGYPSSKERFLSYLSIIESVGCASKVVGR